MILCKTRAEAESALQLVHAWSETNRLTVRPEKTGIVDASCCGGFDFLGYHFEQGGKRWPSQKALRQLRDRVRPLTRRSHGDSMTTIVARLTPVLRGWFVYFQHGNPLDFPRLDSWVRLRLRSIQRSRHKRKGRGRGLDHVRWPNAYFADLGLFSFATAHRLARQSARR